MCIRDSAQPGLRERCYPRVLPSVSSLEACQAAGFPPKQIIAMQGPFSAELNRAVIRQLDISVLVTKESGAAGGFEEKCAAARDTGCRLIVVERPTRERGEDVYKRQVGPQAGGRRGHRCGGPAAMGRLI